MSTKPEEKSPEVQALTALCGDHPEYQGGCELCQFRAEAAAAWLVNQIQKVIDDLD